jgi:hypothetical protein
MYLAERLHCWVAFRLSVEQEICFLYCPTLLRVRSKIIGRQPYLYQTQSYSHLKFKCPSEHLN